MTTPALLSDPSADSSAPVEEEPRVLPTFDALPLSDDLKATLAAMGYLHPTPVQLAVWDPATRGKDCVVQARTGTGKTASFGLPIVDRIVRRSQAAVQVLVLVPTRELAVQVSGELERLGAKKGTKIIAVYGGAPMQRQIDAIEGGAQVVVGTPGRVLDHVRRGTLPTSEVRLLVLDESDEMLSMGFERELTAILDKLPPARQTLLFSATLPPDIERMAKNKLKTPEFITLSGDAIGALSIAHFVYMVTGDKAGTLGRIVEVENPESAVVFCNTKDQTEAVAQALTARGYDADWLNGDLPQSEREKVMTATREGKLRFLVATDVAARGIDISHLTHVINYDFPFDAETYVHRTGRTGRAGRTGTAISLITPQDIGGLYMLRLTYKIRPIERQIPTPGELKTRAEADLTSMLAEAFLAKGTHVEDRALARRLLAHDQIEGILAGLLRDHLGARPTAQDEASAARRATPRRGMLKRREERWRDANAEIRGDAVDGAAPVEGAAAGDAPPRDAFPPRRDRDRPRDDDRRPRFDRSSDDRRDHVAPAPAGPSAGPPSLVAPREEGVLAGGALQRPDPALVEPAPAMAPRAEVPAEGLASGAPRPPRERRPRRDDDRPRDDRPMQPRDDRPRDDRPMQARDDRPRDDARARGGVRHADMVNWQPKAEANDDEPLLGSARAFGGASAPGGAAASSGHAPALESGEPQVQGAEIFVNVGRRDGVRASDLQKVLVDVAGLDHERVQRIRVRDRHSFVTVPPEDVAQVVERLRGASLGGRTVNAEPARGRDEGTVAESA